MTFVRERAEKFDLGRVVSRTFGVIQSDLPMFYAIALVCAGLPIALVQMLQVGSFAHGDFTSPFARVFTLTAVAGSVVTLLARALSDCLLVSGAMAAIDGRKSPFEAQLRASLPLILPVIGIYILSIIAISVGMILLFVPGLIAMCMLSIAVPAEVAERPGVIGALSRSADLTRGHRWAIFGLLLLYAVAIWALTSGVALITGLLFFGGVGKTYFNAEGGPLAYIGVVVTTLVTAAVTMVSAVGVAALYTELRLVKDGPQTQSLDEVFA